jgi:hypothetical protein
MARRVQSTTPSCVGSPEATPSGNGVAPKAVARPGGGDPVASASAVRALPRRKARLLRLRTEAMRDERSSELRSIATSSQKAINARSLKREDCHGVTCARRLDDTGRDRYERCVEVGVSEFYAVFVGS